MKLSTILATVLALSILASAALAAKEAKPKRNKLNGEITRIEGANITIHPRVPKTAIEQPADVVVTTNDATTVTINGEKKTLADLKVGQKAAVLFAADGKTAASIIVGRKRPADRATPDKPAEQAPAK